MNETNPISRVEITHYEQHRLRASYVGAVDPSGALELDKVVELAFGYYRYPTLELAIESPGGLADALVPMATALQRWRARGHAIEVRSTFQCASAAALLLAGGTWGGRSVMPGTALVFHFPRVMVNRAVIKSSAAAHISRRLRHGDERTLSWLCGTVASSAGGVSALALHVAERTAELRSRWDEVAQAMINPLSGDAYGAVPGPSMLKVVERVLAAPVFEAAYRKAVGQMMEQDAPIDLRLAYALGLVDRVEGVLDGRRHAMGVASAERLSPAQAQQSAQWARAREGAMEAPEPVSGFDVSTSGRPTPAG